VTPNYLVKSIENEDIQIKNEDAKIKNEDNIEQKTHDNVKMPSIKEDDLPKLIPIDAHTMQFRAKVLIPGDDQFNLIEIFQNISFHSSILIDEPSVTYYNKNKKSNYADTCMFCVRVTDMIE